MFAARIGDMHVCPMITPGVPPIPHVGGPVLPPCKPQVLIGKIPAATISCMCTCVGPPDVILKGCVTVLIQKLPAARMGDTTSHGGSIVIGCPTVIIGSGAGKAMAKGGSVSIPAPPDPAAIAQMMAERVETAANVSGQLESLNEQLAEAQADGDQDAVDNLQNQIAAQEALLAV